MLIGELAVAVLIRGAAAHEAQVRQYDVGVATRKRHRPVRADFVRKHGADLLAALKPVLYNPVTYWPSTFFKIELRLVAPG